MAAQDESVLLGSLTSGLASPSDEPARRVQTPEVWATWADTPGFHFLAEAIPQQVWTARPDGTLDHVSTRCLEYFGRSYEQMLGAGWLGVLHPDDVAPCIARWTHSLTSGEIYEVEFRLRRASDGAYRWHLGRALPQRDPGGRIVKWFGTNTDIDDRKRDEEALRAMEAALRSAKEVAELANRAKSEFLANISHELRTPLNAVIGYSELLYEEARERELADFLPDLEKIRTAGTMLLSLINNVLDLSKIEAGKMETVSVPYDVDALVREVGETVAPLLVRGENVLRIECPSPIGEVSGDRGKVRQCLLNLLSNAAKFTTRGTVTLGARREGEGAEGRIVFSVSDTGEGMDPATCARIFEAFFQADGGGKIGLGGTGLGLPITRRLCLLMGGEITVRSKKTEGTCFTLRLPAVGG